MCSKPEKMLQHFELILGGVVDESVWDSAQHWIVEWGPEMLLLIHVRGS